MLNTPHLRKIINDVKEASNRLEIDFFGLGALARNIWYVENDKHPRGTKDVDFGVYVPSDTVYNNLRELLISEFGYQEVSENAFCLISPYRIPVDLLPFGEIENQGKVIIEGKGIVSISLHGFLEVYTKGLVEATLEGDIIKICSIPSVVLLKLIAYDDRPEQRLSDPLDISSIFEHYPQIEANLIWDEYNFLYDEDREHEDVGMIVLGYEISKIISGNKQLENRVLNILHQGIIFESRLAERMIKDNHFETAESKSKLLSLLRGGIIAGLKNVNQ